jgi:mannose-6-phosphate isomerase-like protein (cupin superfamily)
VAHADCQGSRLCDDPGVAEALVFPDGSTYTVIGSPADPEREPLLMEFLLMPDCAAPPPHVHPGGQRETFEVVEGAFELRQGSDWHRLAAGESLTVKPGEVHTFRNREGAPVRVRDVHDPAHSFEPYIRRLHALVSEHGFTGVSPRAALYLSLLWREHRDTIVPATAPQRVAMALLAAIGRALRLRLPA